MRQVVAVSLLIIVCSGCSSLHGLMQYSKEQDALQRYVSDQKREVERLFKDIEEKKLTIGKMTKGQVMRRYGEPVLAKQIDEQEQWLYREAAEYFSSKKVYLFFDEDGILANIEVPSLRIPK